MEDFRNNFKNLYDETIDYSQKMNFLKIDGVFHNECIDIRGIPKEKLDKIKTYGINTKNQNVFDEIIYIERKYCKIGDSNNRD